MKKIKYVKSCFIMRLAFIFDASNDSSLYIPKKVIIFKVSDTIFSGFKSFYVIVTKYITYITQKT